MPFFIVELTEKPHTLRNGVDQLVVSAETETDARAMAKAQSTGYVSDSAWDAAIATELAAETVSDANALVGWRFNIDIPDAVPPISVGVVGDATNDTLDEIGTALAAALNADAQIANAGYTAGTQTLIVAQGVGDGLGDKTVVMNVFPPEVIGPGGKEDQDENIPGFVVSITDQGLAAADLTVVLAADTFTLPVITNKAQADRT